MDIGGVIVMVFNATVKQYFSYIVEISFIGGENQSNRRKKHRPAASH
jgi:hypothetical protein